MNWLADAIWNTVAIFGLLDAYLITERYFTPGRHRRGEP